MGELVGDKSPATALMERWIATMQWGSGSDVLLGNQGMMGEGWLHVGQRTRRQLVVVRTAAAAVVVAVRKRAVACA